LWHVTLVSWHIMPSSGLSCQIGEKCWGKYTNRCGVKKRVEILNMRSEKWQGPRKVWMALELQWSRLVVTLSFARFGTVAIHVFVPSYVFILFCLPYMVLYIRPDFVFIASRIYCLSTCNATVPTPIHELCPNFNGYCLLCRCTVNRALINVHQHASSRSHPIPSHSVYTSKETADYTANFTNIDIIIA
jgi:hypothetical protein